MMGEMSDDLIRRHDAIDAVRHAVFEFFDICEDDDESPMTYNDKRLLELNKAITSRLKELPPACQHKWLTIPTMDGWEYICEKCGARMVKGEVDE